MKLTDNFLANTYRPEELGNGNGEIINSKARMSLEPNGVREGVVANSRRKRENVIVSSRSGSNIDNLDGLDSPRNFRDNDSPDALQPDDGNDRIVLLKISMENSSGSGAI